MPFLLLEKTALTCEDLELITATHVPILSVYEDTGRKREQQFGYPRKVGFIYEQSALERYVQKYETIPELNEDLDEERPDELTARIQPAQNKYGNDLIAAIGEWKREVPELIRQCYAPYILWAKKERAEEIKKEFEV
ncbi:hypothetical protein HZA99_05535 [Candidatus Woesearchaeota archaeon]|nr:hypothetical protein [Candidatus Woesearchaeota archaeon]